MSTQSDNEIGLESSVTLNLSICKQGERLREQSIWNPWNMCLCALSKHFLKLLLYEKMFHVLDEWGSCSYPGCLSIDSDPNLRMRLITKIFFLHKPISEEKINLLIYHYSLWKVPRRSKGGSSHIGFATHLDHLRMDRMLFHSLQWKVWLHIWQRVKCMEILLLPWQKWKHGSCLQEISKLWRACYRMCGQTITFFHNGSYIFKSHPDCFKQH